MPTHGQSKSMSMVEAVVNTVVGLGVAMVATAAICKAYGIPMTWENNFIITFWMTVISILRSYILRRMFNGGWRAPQPLRPAPTSSEPVFYALGNKNGICYWRHPSKCPEHQEQLDYFGAKMDDGPYENVPLYLVQKTAPVTRRNTS